MRSAKMGASSPHFLFFISWMLGQPRSEVMYPEYAQPTDYIPGSPEPACVAQGSHLDCTVLDATNSSAPYSRARPEGLSTGHRAWPLGLDGACSREEEPSKIPLLFFP